MYMLSCVIEVWSISFVVLSLDLNPDYKICGEMVKVKPALFSLKKQEAESVFCGVQVLHMYRDRTAAVRKWEQLFWFGATSIFAIPFMKQCLPHRVGMPFLGCVRDGDPSFFSRVYKVDFCACLLSPTNSPFCMLWMIRVQIKLSTYVDSIIVHNLMNAKWI